MIHYILRCWTMPITILRRGTAGHGHMHHHTAARIVRCAWFAIGTGVAGVGASLGTGGWPAGSEAGTLGILRASPSGGFAAGISPELQEEISSAISAGPGISVPITTEGGVPQEFNGIPCEFGTTHPCPPSVAEPPSHYLLLAAFALFALWGLTKRQMLVLTSTPERVK